LLERLSILYPAGVISRQQLPRPYLREDPINLTTQNAAAP